MIGEDQPHVNAPIWGRPPPYKQALTLVFSSMESKSNGPGIGTVFCRLMARMGMNWNLKQLGQLFQVLMLYLQKSTPPPHLKKNSRLMLSDGICLKPCLQLYSSIFL